MEKPTPFLEFISNANLFSQNSEKPNNYWEFFNLQSSSEINQYLVSKPNHAKKKNSRQKKEINKGITVKDQNTDISYSRPTWFLALPISSPEIHTTIKSLQENFLGLNISVNKGEGKQINEMGMVYYASAMPVSRSHITLFLFNADSNEGQKNDSAGDERLEIVKESVKRAIKEYKQSFSDKKSIAPLIDIRLEGVGHFEQKVIFVKSNLLENQDFKLLWTALANQLLANYFISEKDADITTFKPHVTVMKLPKRRKKLERFRRKDPKRFLPQKFPQNCVDGLEQKLFGKQSIDRIQLLSLRKKEENAEYSYYFCKEEFLFTNSTPLISKPSDHTNCCAVLSCDQ